MSNGSANRGTRPGASDSPSQSPTPEQKIQTEQIEYLIHQSTLGVHFLFDAEELRHVLSTPTDDKDFFTIANMERVQNLLTSFLEKESLRAKETFLETLDHDSRILLIRAYFHLVENTIQSNFQLKH